MLKYFVRRLLEAVPTTFGILLLTFFLFNIVAGSPAQTILGKNASAESIAEFNRKWGYDKPLIIGDGNIFDSQFFTFVGDLCRGELGYSVEMNAPVAEVLRAGVSHLRRRRLV